MGQGAFTIQTHARGALPPTLTARATGGRLTAASRHPHIQSVATRAQSGRDGMPGLQPWHLRGGVLSRRPAPLYPAAVRASSLESRGGALACSAAPAATLAERRAAARAETARDHQSSSCAATSSAAQMVAHGHGEGSAAPQLPLPQTFPAGIGQVSRLSQLSRRTLEQANRRVRRASGREQLMLTRQGVRHRLVQNSLHRPGLLHGRNMRRDTLSVSRTNHPEIRRAL